MSTATTSAAADAVSAVTGSVRAVTTVTAVVVTRGANPWFTRTLAAVRAQDRAPDRVVVVDVAASRASSGYGDLQLGGARFVPAPDAATFGAGVQAALADEPASAWLWLLHEDSAPAPSALGHLLRAVENSGAIAIAGAKQNRWAGTGPVGGVGPGARRPDDEDDDLEAYGPDPAPPELVEVGVTTSRLGRRTTAVDEHEIDQGQYDARDDVFAVGLAGALVRRTVWDELGGTDPAYGPFGDGLDLSRRARLAGHRVVVVPDAVVEHDQLALRGADPRDPEARPGARTPGTDASFGARRTSEIYYRLATVPAALLPFAALWALVAAPVRAAYRLALKRPALARDELVAPLLVAWRTPALVRARRSAARTSSVPRRTVRPLQATWRDVVEERNDRRLTQAERRRAVYAPSELERAELRQLARRRRLTLAALVAVLVAATVLVFAPVTGALLAGGRLVGGALLPAGGTWSALSASAGSGWLTGGFGSDGPADPWQSVLLAVSLVTAGHVQAAVNGLLVAALLLAGLGAWFAAGTLTRSGVARVCAALTWTAAPALLGALGAGRLGAVAAHVVLPWLVVALLRGFGGAADDRVEHPAGRPAARPGAAHDERDRSSLGALAAASLLLVGLLGAAPVLVAPVLVLALVAVVALVLHRGRHGLAPALHVGLVLVPAAVLLAPFWWHVARTWSTPGLGWRLLLAEPSATPTGYAQPAGWALALAQPQAPAPLLGLTGTAGRVSELALVLPVALVALAGLVALAVSRRPRGVRAAWLTALVGLATAVVATHVTVAVAQDGPVRAWPGAATSLVLAGLLGAGLQLAPRRVRVRTFYDDPQRWRRAGVAVVGVVGILLPTAAATLWALDATRGPDARVGAVHADTRGVVPLVGSQLQQGPAAPRVLTLDVADGVVRAAVLRGDGPQLTEASAVLEGRALGRLLPGGTALPATDPDVRLAEAAARLAGAAGTSAPSARTLTDLGVGAVLVPRETAMTAAERRALEARLDGVAGLVRMTEGSAPLWRVDASRGESAEDAGAWATVTTDDPDGPVTPLASAGADAGRAATGRIAASDEPRRIVLASRADGSWRAELGGRGLRAVPDDAGWRQVFEVPAGASGQVTVTYDDPSRTPWRWACALVLVVAVLLALPVRRRRVVLR